MNRFFCHGEEQGRDKDSQFQAQGGQEECP